jgi:methyl-accepting chemotaxis protein
VQVNTAIGQMERVVQRNAALVEQAAQGTEAMNAQAAALLQIARGFRLDAQAPVAPAAAESAPRPIALKLRPRAPAARLSGWSTH